MLLVDMFINLKTQGVSFFTFHAKRKNKKNIFQYLAYRLLTRAEKKSLNLISR